MQYIPQDVENLIRHLVNQRRVPDSLRGRINREDLDQELRLQYWKSKTKYNPALGCELAYMKVVLRRHLTRFLARQLRWQVVERRYCHRSHSDWLKQLTFQAELRRQQQTTQNTLKTVDWKLDESKYYAGLSIEQRGLIKRIIISSSAQVAREEGVAHSTMQYRFGNYLKRISWDEDPDFSVGN